MTTAQAGRPLLPPSRAARPSRLGRNMGGASGISILCPTRNRPGNVQRLVDSALWHSTCPVEFIFRTDSDAPGSLPYMPDVDYTAIEGDRGILSDLWNDCAKAARYDIMMHCGDDIAFRSKDWDFYIFEAFRDYNADHIAQVYGNDLIHGDDGLATHGFLHRRWVDAVGYFTPPYFSCDYADTWLSEVARMIGRQRYLPGVITEHMHPNVGKAPWDQNHADRAARGERDGVAALYASMWDRRMEDAAKLRSVMFR